MELLEREEKRVKIFSQLAIQLAPVLGVSALYIEDSLTEVEILDYKKAHLENQGIDTRTSQERYKDAGFNDNDMERIKTSMSEMRTNGSH